MKNLFYSGILAYVVAVTIAVCGFGCATIDSAPPTREAVVYYTFRDVQIMADAAEKVYGNQVVLGHVNAERQAKIDEKIVKLHTHFRIALRLARADYNAAVPSELQAMANELVLLVNTLDRN